MSDVELFVSTRGKVLDAVTFSGALHAVSDRLRPVFELVADDVEFVPLNVNGDRFWFLRVTSVVDALDLEHSTIRYLCTGSVDAVEEPVWRQESVDRPRLFTIPQLRVTTWATRPIADAYEASGCTGLFFWPRGRVAA
ncbi:MAG: hypothetical protein M3394_03950 [Actinomycetota bacterium]|nr:hypothetical protein [Actinomycetota bacterium]